MDSATAILMTTAATVGLGHTLVGPDHYLPFIMMSRAQGWRMPKTLGVTVLCGIGHVLSSIVLGLIGIAAGWALTRMKGIEGTRGEWAAWGLIAFGLLYAVWGLWHARKGRTHTHRHLHDVGQPHEHEHDHHSEHAHVHADAARPASITPWVLFVVFVLGPCEPLIPLMVAAAAKGTWLSVTVVAGTFSLVTVATMTAVVLAASLGLKQVRFAFAQRYMHAIAGGVIALSGLAIKALGL